MKLVPTKRQELTSATITQTLGLILACSGLFALTAFGSPPAWWSSRGAVVAPVVTTNDGVVTTNYISNDYAVVTQGQLKQFTARAVDELNTNLSGGAGTNLNTLVSNWASDYATHGYNATNIKPSDYTAMNVGQLKYIGNQVWAPLVAAGYTNTTPSWLQQNINTDGIAANLGQLKEVFDFDLSAWTPPGPFPEITSGATVTTAVDVTFSYAITASNTPTSYSATGLPAGLSVNTTTGVISGTPTATGIFNVNLSATNGYGTGTGVVVMNVGSSSTAPAINSPSAAVNSVGLPVAYQITASNNPTQFGATNLPAGLSINPATGAISGAVTTAGIYTINLSASNGAGTGTEALTLAINTSGTSSSGPAPVITSSLTASATAGQSFSYSFTASNSPTSYGAIDLPGGLSLNTSTGAISGTPTSGGIYAVLISATNANGTNIGLLNLTIASAAPAITSSTTANTAVGTAFSYLITATNVPTSYSASSLPTGLTIDSTTGIISGTTSSVGAFTISLGATNATGAGSATLTLTVLPQGWPAITSSTIAYGTTGQSFTYTIATSNTATSFGETGSLPAGLSLNSTTGVISGTLTESGAFTVAVTATNGNGTGTASLTVYMGDTPIITSALTANATVNSPFSYTIAVTADTSTVINGPVTFSATGLPSGFTLDSTTGIISGTATPDEVGTPTITINAINALGTTTASLVLDIQCAANTAYATPGSSFSYQAPAVTGATSYSAAGLPDGLSIDATTGIISGTPTDPGTYTVTVTNDTGTGTTTLTFYVGTAPTLPSDLTASATMNSPFSYTITGCHTTDATPTYFATRLPAGLTIDPATGIISGTPLPGDFYHVRVFFGVTTIYGTATSSVFITFTPFINDPLIASGNLNVPFSYAVSIQSYANSPSFSASGLPAGLSIDPDGSLTGTAGTIFGTPTASPGTYDVSITATNSIGTGLPATLAITIAGTPTLTVGSQSASGEVGRSFTYSASNLPVTYSPPLGNATSYSVGYPTFTYPWSSLPTGFTMDSSGNISGTPAAAGTDAAGITVTDGLGNSATGTLNLLFYSGPGISSALTANADVGHSFSYQLSTIHTASSTSATGLPTGLTYTSGTISGTPTTAGTYNITLSATDSDGTSTATLVLTVGSITSSSTATAYVGESFSFTVTDDDTPTNFQASNLPAGFSIDSSSGIITGTPVAAETVPINLTVIDAGGTEISTLLLTIAPNPGDTQISLQQGVSPTSSYSVPSVTIAYDTYPANSATADQTFNTGTVLTVGKTTSTASSRALLGFDLSALPANATITSAKLVMNTSSGNSSGAICSVEVHQTSAPFAAATANWANNSSYNDTLLSALTLNPSASASSNTFLANPVLTQAVQQAYNQSGKLYLALLVPSVERGSTPDYIGFTTNASDPTQNPQLIVTYTVGSATAIPVITSATTVTGTVSVPLSYTITASQNPTSYTATGLPSGLTLNTSTGVISGTVTAVSSTVATVSATNSIGAGSRAVTFNIDSATQATCLRVISGNYQIGAPGVLLTTPLVVKASADGSPVANALVTFTVAPGKGALAATNTGSPATSNTLTRVTDGSGQATVYFLLPQSLGASTIIASAGTAQPVSLVETSALDASGSSDSLALLSVISGEGQSGPAGETLPQPFVVQATNASGQPVVSQSLVLTVVSGGCGISTTSGGTFGSPLSVSTDGSGNATIYLQPGGSDGTINKVSCVATTSAGQATVYLTALTISTSSSSPTPGGGTPPVTDHDPAHTTSPFTLTVSEAPVSSPYAPDPTKVALTWPTLSGVDSYQVQKRIDQTGAWVTLGSESSGYEDSGLVAGHDYQYQVEAISGSFVVATTPISSYVVPLIKGFVTSSTFFGWNLGPFFLYYPAASEDEAIADYNTAFEDLQYWGTQAPTNTLTPPGADKSSVLTVFQNYNYPSRPWIDNNSATGWTEVTFQIEFNPTDTGSVPTFNWIQEYTTGPFFQIFDVTGGSGWMGYYVSDTVAGYVHDPDVANEFHTTSTPVATPVVSGGTSGSYTWEPNAADTTQSESYVFALPIHFVIPDGYGGYLNDADASGHGLDLSVGSSAIVSQDTFGLSRGWYDYGYDYGYGYDDGYGYGYGYGYPYAYGPTNISAAQPATLTYTGPIRVEGNNGLYGAWISISNGASLDYIPTLEIIPLPDATDGATASVTITSSTAGTSTVNFTIHNSPANGDLSMPIDEASGSRYRKIALNGLPMSDEKPQQSAESDQEKEETYIDALTLGLRHSTTDAYLPVSGSDFSVSARRDFRSQVWNERNGLRPHEQPDLPFGVCWSSNLAPNIKLVTTTDPKKTQPDQAIVTDETGASHTFFAWYDSAHYNAIKFFPMPTAKNEAQVPNLETLTVDNTTTPETYIFKRKYGATLTYQGTSLNLSIANDRTLGYPGSLYSTINHYARLIQAMDRVGNVVNYQFQGTSNLIPKTITVANQPGIKLSIEQKPISSLTYLSIDSPQSVITAIWDANGNKTCYHYCVASGDLTAVALDKVTMPDGATTHYTYSAQSEADQTPHATTDPGNTYWYADIASITDPLGNAYGFSYTLDHSKLNHMSNPAVYTGYYIQSGSPRNITTVTMPDSTTASFVNTNNPVLSSSYSSIFLENNSGGTGLIVSGPRQSKITDATGFIRTYKFDNADIVPLPQFPDPYSTSVVASKIIVWQDLTIGYGSLGNEAFQFDINSAMALSQITDLSGNVTTFAHTDAWSAPADYTQILNTTVASVNGFYDDPTKQTDALGHFKTFTYFGANRVMQSSTDENGNKTYYDIDSLGRRTSEKLYDSSNDLVQETDFTYGSSAYPGFMTKKCVKALGGSDPSWVKPLVTTYAPDANGRVAQEIVDPNGLALATKYTYDANGNKLTATDPKGNTSWFSYDSRNRLITVTNAAGGQKQMVYDSRGNKTKEYDENGIATLYQYDALNRVTAQARDMNGNGVIDSGADLITAYTYNAVNAKLTTTSPTGGVTTLQYDDLQRVTQITDALSHVTQFAYGANSGGNTFDGSSFKPTHTVDPRGFTTDVTFDALYRPVTKAVQYSTTASPSATSTQYDAAGNATLVTDPLGHQTAVTYDVLNRPLVTTLADASTTQAFYTSTGFKWQVIDPNGNTTRTAYDTAGRAVSVIQGYGTSAAAATTTAYDAAGNVAATVNPLGNEWDYAYDARNRKVQEFEPAVLDAVSNSTLRPMLAWQYDQGGRVVAAIDARSNETDTHYDAANRVIEVDQPAVSAGTPQTFSTYDMNGNVLTVTDPNGHATTNTYDLLNRLLTTTDAAGIVVANTYDAVGNKLTVVDGGNHTTSFAYDGMSRNTAVTDAAGKSTQLRYDAMNKVQRIDALGQTTSYLYDVRNRLQHIVYASSAAANSQRNYAYDAMGNLLSVTEPAKTAANVGYTYDALNRAITETSQGQTHAYTYDLAGNRVSTVYGGTSRTITSTYDALNRLSAMVEGGRTTSYGYDLNGNIAQKTAPNGDTEAYSFDALNRAAQEVATAGPSGGLASLFTYQYGYDLVGNVVNIVETYPSGLDSRTVANTYDAINRLTVEAVTASTNVTTAYTYDAGNNCTSTVVTGGADAGTTNYTYNKLNQLTSYGNGTRGASLHYDFNGNRVNRIVSGGSDAGTDTYSYDFENRLIGLVKGTGGGTGTYAYTYDYRTRRIVRDESGVAGGTITNLVFSGGTSVQEYDGTTPSLTVEYIRGSDYGGGVGGILYTLRSGTPSYTHENRRGDVVAKTDGSGSLIYQAQYEASGKVIAASGSTLDRQGANTKDTDPWGGIDEGRRITTIEGKLRIFMTKDPAGFVDGPNLYTYVRQNPWTKFDPEGLTAWDRVEGAAQGISNGAIDIANGAIWVANTFANPSPTDGSPYIPQFNNIGNATDKNDFISGQNGGSVFIAGTTAMLGGPEAGGGKAIVAEGEKILQAGAEDATKAAGTKVTEAPKPVESPAPGGQSAAATKTDADFSADLSQSNATSRSGHSNAGNKQLNDAMAKDPALRKTIETKYGDDAFDRTSTSNGGRRNPKGAEWDHNSSDSSKLDLKSKDDHAQKTRTEGQAGGGWKKFHKDKTTSSTD